jgi:putative endonuclease
MCQWSVYILRCSDNSLYTGIATDVSRRMREHEVGKTGAKYLRGRTPITLMFQQEVGDRSCASRVEHHIKQLSKREKERFVGAPDLLRTYILTLTNVAPEESGQ